jgi:protein-S-isoprenylcysteine O-methyltransferase Ste14
VSDSKRFAFRGLGAVLSNLLLATLFISFAYAHLQRFLAQPRLSLLLIIAVEGLVAVMLVIRRDPENTQHGWKTWVATSIGTFAPMLMRPSDASTDLLVGQILQTVAFGLQIGAVLSLNRSFGLLPAHRGVKSDGLYRWVRHPLYSTYLMAHVGYLASNISWANVLVVVTATTFQVVRILQEEHLLLQYPDYARYSGTTRWRLVPAIW